MAKPAEKKQVKYFVSDPIDPKKDIEVGGYLRAYRDMGIIEDWNISNGSISSSAGLLDGLIVTITYKGRFPKKLENDLGKSYQVSKIKKPSQIRA